MRRGKGGSRVVEFMSLTEARLIELGLVEEKG